MTLVACTTPDKDYTVPIVYQLAPQLLLSQIDNGDYATSFSQDDTYKIPDNEIYSISWSSEELYKIVEAFLEYSNNGKLTEWNIVEVVIYQHCEKVQNGFNNLFIKLSRETKKEGRNSVLEKNIEISPSYGYLEEYETSYFDYLGTENRIRLDTINETPELALRIAEDNGGRQIREQINDECEYGVFSQQKFNKGWNVILFDKDHPTGIFTYFVEFTAK